MALAAANPIVDSGDHMTFTINLASSQSSPGTYQFMVGPDVRDTAGNLMNQDNDAVQGNGFLDTLRRDSCRCADGLDACVALARIVPRDLRVVGLDADVLGARRPTTAARSRP